MMTLHRIFVKWQCFIGRGLDIWSTGKYPCNVLSNLYGNAFEINGVKCASMEGFLQSLKYQDANRQREICSMKGKEAKKMTTTTWQKDQIVWWQGAEIHRQGEDFQQLVRRAYKMMFEQNERFRTALMATRGKTLYHSRGSNNSWSTILTRDELCTILMELRDGYDKKIMDKAIGKTLINRVDLKYRRY